MVSNEQIQRVHELARQRFSQRAISRMAGVSRDTVRRILTGKRQIMHMIAPVRLPAPNCSRPPRRCPGCGARVFMPCLACGVRNLKHAPQ